MSKPKPLAELPLAELQSMLRKYTNRFTVAEVADEMARRLRALDVYARVSNPYGQQQELNVVRRLLEGEVSNAE